MNSTLNYEWGKPTSNMYGVKPPDWKKKLKRFLHYVQMHPSAPWNDDFGRRRREDVSQLIREHGFAKVAKFVVSETKREVALVAKREIKVSETWLATTFKKSELALMGGLLLFGVYACLGLESNDAEAHIAQTKSHIGSSFQMVQKQRVRHERVENGVANTSTVDFGLIAGSNVGKWEHAPTATERNLNALYAGVEGVLPQSATINECEQFKAAWRAKIARKEVTGATLTTIPYIIEHFCKGTRTFTNIATFVGDINEELPRINASIDYRGLCANEHYQLNVDRCALLQEITEKTTGEDLVAYGMTELMPAQKKGLFNARLVDHMLMNCSLECVMNFPALNDKMASVGFWQFTSFAVYSIRRDGQDARGASIVSMYAGDDFKIATSVVGEHGLRADQHAIAAHYFGIHNIALLLRYADDKEVSELRRVVEAGRMEEILTFKAIAHHLPGGIDKHGRRTYSIGYMTSWLAHGAQGSLRDHLGHDLTIYAIKTHYNLVGLQQFLALEGAKNTNQGGV